MRALLSLWQCIEPGRLHGRECTWCNLASAVRSVWNEWSMSLSREELL